MIVWNKLNLKRHFVCGAVERLSCVAKCLFVGLLIVFVGFSLIFFAEFSLVFSLIMSCFVVGNGVMIWEKSIGF